MAGPDCPRPACQRSRRPIYRPSRRKARAQPACAPAREGRRGGRDCTPAEPARWTKLRSMEDAPTVERLDCVIVAAPGRDRTGDPRPWVAARPEEVQEGVGPAAPVVNDPPRYGAPPPAAGATVPAHRPGSSRRKAAIRSWPRQSRGSAWHPPGKTWNDTLKAGRSGMPGTSSMRISPGRSEPCPSRIGSMPDNRFSSRWLRAFALFRRPARREIIRPSKGRARCRSGCWSAAK